MYKRQIHDGARPFVTEEIAEAICQKENCILDGEKEKLNLCSMELEKVLSPDSKMCIRDRLYRCKNGFCLSGRTG